MGALSHICVVPLYCAVIGRTICLLNEKFEQQECKKLEETVMFVITVMRKG